jgi:hypothetical protein
MSLATKSSASVRTQGRIWRVPISKARWYWLAASMVLYVIILVWYLFAIRTQQFAGPFNDPLRLFGIVAFILVLATAAYALRRRFVRGLPGKVQDWLWMHTWVGIITILIALLHENFAHVTHDFCQNLTCFSNSYWGTAALFALLFLVVSGVVGRLLDMWQAHIIASEASTNGVGIVRALEERILELEYVVERLCAGKSEPFKQYCMQAIEGNATAVPSLTPNEQVDFQRAYETLTTRSSLIASLQREQRARQLIRTWRTVHMVLAGLALLIILYHSSMELLTSVFHVIPAT